jgi:cobaltochelatase CobT
MQARGVADGYALRLKHHNPAIHNRAQPAEATARACFDAVEQVRYEALGANGYNGIRANLGAALEQRIAAIRSPGPNVPIRCLCPRPWR